MPMVFSNEAVKLFLEYLLKAEERSEEVSTACKIALSVNLVL